MWIQSCCLLIKCKRVTVKHSFVKCYVLACFILDLSRLYINVSKLSSGAHIIAGYLNALIIIIYSLLYQPYAYLII